MAKKTKGATLAEQLAVAKGSLSDAEAECKRLTADVGYWKDQCKTEVLQTERDNWATRSAEYITTIDRLQGERDDHGANLVSLSNQLERSKTHTFAAWVIGAIGWICFFVATLT